MKEATGELNMTVVTIIAIGAIIRILLVYVATDKEYNYWTMEQYQY